MGRFTLASFFVRLADDENLAGTSEVLSTKLQALTGGEAPAEKLNGIMCVCVHVCLGIGAPAVSFRVTGDPGSRYLTNYKSKASSKVYERCVACDCLPVTVLRAEGYR